MPCAVCPSFCPSVHPSHPGYHSTACNIWWIVFIFGTAIGHLPWAWTLLIMGFLYSSSSIQWHFEILLIHWRRLDGIFYLVRGAYSFCMSQSVMTLAPTLQTAEYFLLDPWYIYEADPVWENWNMLHQKIKQKAFYSDLHLNNSSLSWHGKQPGINILAQVM